MKPCRQLAGRRPPLAGAWNRAAALFLGCLLAAGAGCRRDPSPSPGAGAPSVRTVQTAPARMQRLERTIKALGSLEAYEDATLSTKVAGRLQDLAADVGTVVRQGDVLARIEARDYELRVDQARAALGQARARVGLPLEGDDDAFEVEKVSAVKEAWAVRREAEMSFERSKALAAQGVSSKAEVDAAEAACLVAVNRYQDAAEEVRERQAIVAQRRVEYAIARQQLADTVIAAPFDGGIQERKADRGEYLAAGTPVIRVVRLDPLRLRLEVSEREAPRIQAGQQVRLFLEGATNTCAGTIQRLSPALAENNRMLVVEADVPNPGRLHPGSFVRAEILTADVVEAVVVPTNAVVVFTGIEKVFVVSNQVVLEKRILTGDRAGGGVEVLAGLKGGETVVLNPAGLQTGHPVKIEP